MRKVIAWTLGILVRIDMVYVGCSSIMTQDFLMGETKVATGKVIKVFPSKEVQTMNRKIKYVYSVGDKFYADFKKLGTQDDKQAIGNELKVLYSVNNPEWNRVERLIPNSQRYRSTKFYSSKKEGYIDLELNNGIFIYKEFADGGKIVNDFIGEYKITNDTLKFRHYLLGNNNPENYRPTQFVFDKKYGTRIIIETKTKRIFKRF